MINCRMYTLYGKQAEYKTTKFTVKIADKLDAPVSKKIRERTSMPFDVISKKLYQ